MTQKFYHCERCGKVISASTDNGAPIMCCGQRMQEIVPGAIGAEEKHMPMYSVDGNKVYVSVGEVEHPMLPEHYIAWIGLQTKQGWQQKCLKPGGKPEAVFTLWDGDEVEAIYAYCNLHSLWKAEYSEPLVCDLQPVDTKTNENYIVCKCNQVSYFDILDEINHQGNLTDVLNVFEAVKNTTRCSTGCGGCYDKVIAIISDTLMSGVK